MDKNKIEAFIGRQKVAFICSVDEEGYPNVKAMLKPRKMEGLQHFYFSTNTSSMRVKATPHNHRLKPLHTIHLQIFRHLSQIFLERRQPSCVKFRKPDEKSDGVSGTQ